MIAGDELFQKSSEKTPSGTTREPPGARTGEYPADLLIVDVALCLRAARYRLEQKDLERLPPSASRPALELLGKILELNPTAASTAALRLGFFNNGFSWPALVAFANAHELLPPLVLALRQRSLLFPVPQAADADTRDKHITSRLTSAYNEHLARQDDLRDQLVAIVAALNRRKITPLLIKGACHLTATEGWSLARGMRDLDLVVRPEQADDAKDVLIALGYWSDDTSELSGQHHLAQMQRRDRHGAVEIHTAALAFNAAHVLTDDEIWQLSSSRNFQDASFCALPAAWHLLHGVLHHQVSDRGHARYLLALKGLWEFCMAANELSNDEWRLIASHMEARGRLDVLSSWIVQANRLFGLAVPDVVQISDAARDHADTTLRRAAWPYPARRALFIADQLRFAFDRETLALRYDSDPGQSTLGIAGKHLVYLARKYRGDALRRVVGSSKRVS